MIKNILDRLKKWLPTILLIINLSCANKKERRKPIYYIIGNDDSVAVTDPSEPPPPEAPFYGKINLILFADSLVYMHKVIELASHHEFLELINLKKVDVFKMNKISLKKFLTKEYAHAGPGRQIELFTCIKSSSDTISNECFPIIEQFFNDKKFKSYIIRKWTDEEQQVIMASP